MELAPYSDEDMWLTEALECDPEVMAELGGPIPREDIPATHQRRLAAQRDGNAWLKIVPDPGGPPVGTIGIWEQEWKGETIHEVGWLVLPEFQGRGLATEALGMLLDRVRADPRIEAVHAFPGVTNAASNALCRRFGFSMTGTEEVAYADRILRVNHWRLDLS